MHSLSPKQWLRDSAAPLWLDLGIDRKDGGFFETIDANDLRPSGDIKRLRTVSRQIFVFCALGRHGVASAEGAVEHGLAFLLRNHARDDGAFHERVSQAGKPIEGDTSLYDLAFALFALANAYALTSDRMLRDRALLLMHYLDGQCRHPQWGFTERLPSPPHREQNPHMHLLEAALAWMDADPDGPFRDLAISLLADLDTHIFQADLSILSEFPQTQTGLRADLHRWEPGHHFEWIWLLERAAAHDLPVPQISDMLGQRALMKGLSAPAQVPFGALAHSDEVIEQECRIWQVTEWARVAALNLLGKSLEDDSRSVQLLDRFLDFHVPGLWYERCHCADGKMIEEPVKATSFYHVVGAMEALIERDELNGSYRDGAVDHRSQHLNSK